MWQLPIPLHCHLMAALLSIFPVCGDESIITSKVPSSLGSSAQLWKQLEIYPQKSPMTL